MGSAGVSFYLSVLALLNGLILLARARNPERFFLGVWLLLFSYDLFYRGLFTSRLILEVPHLFGTIAPVQFAILGVIYIYLTYLLEPGLSWRKTHLPHFVVPVVRLITLIPLYTRAGPEKEGMIRAALLDGRVIEIPGDLNALFISLTLVLYALAYAALLSRKIRWDAFFAHIRGTKKFNNALFLILVWGTGILILNLLQPWVDFPALGKRSALLFLLIHTITFLFLIFLQIIPHLERLEILSLDRGRSGIQLYVRSRLESADLSELQENLERLIEEDKIYRDPEMNLKKFAAQMGISVHQLSEYCNRNLNVRFNDFLNEKRVREAERLLKEEPDKKVVEICFETGFNSTSSFYQNFKKFAQASPEEYRKSPGE